MNLRPLRPDQEQKPHTRWSYHQNSKDFVKWVNSLGFERTWFGRIVHNLDQYLHLRFVAFLFLFALSLSFFISWGLDVSYSGYKEGDLASSDIKSPISFDVVDQEETSKRRQAAEASIPPVFDYDVNIYDQQAARLRKTFRKFHSDPSARLAPEERVKRFSARQDEFESDLGGIKVPRETYLWLARQGFRLSLEENVASLLERFSTLKIIDDVKQIRRDDQSRIIINILERGFKGEEFVIESGGVIDLQEIDRRVNRSLCHNIRDANGCAQLLAFARAMLVPNLTLNKQETEARRLQARDSIPPFVVQIKKGQTIVRQGAPLQKIQVAMLDELRNFQDTRHQDFVSFVTAIFLVILLLSYRSFLERFMNRLSISLKDSVAMGAILFMVIGIAKFIMFVANSALVEHFTQIPPSFYYYLAPVGAGAMMVGLLIPAGEVIWLFSMFIAVLAGLLLDRDFIFMIVTFTSSIVAARGVYGCKKREDLYLAGLKTGFVNAALIFCATLMNQTSTGSLGGDVLWNTCAGFLSGVLSSFLTLTLIPFWETVFVYTTDVKLLELSNLNHPLLKDLIVKAPGTYHHSLVVGSMCEAAAEAIGANPLLAKVCAYYHDIGKTEHAKYFIENQKPGENKHDQINPGMSKTILIAHVKDGVEMGLKHKLGRSIIDVIEQHHGTTLISFFYHKAKEVEDSEMHEVSEDEYRYPGPKPKFREAALCMLADSIEAAARSLDEPTPARLQSIVKNIVQKKFLDGQLDDCQLTLKNMTDIEEAFSRILLGIYHQRIDYPTSSKPEVKRPHQTVS